MRKGISALSKALSFLLALLLVIPTGSLPAVMLASAAEGSVVVTDGDLVAENYASLTDGEKEILKSGLVKGNAYTLNTPDDSDDLVKVDAEALTIKASDFNDGEYVWKPVAARVIHGEEVETVELTDGEGKFNYDGNVYSVEVDYVTEITVPSETQRTLLNGPYNLVKAIDNLNVLADYISDFDTIASNTPSLMRLTDGSLPGNTVLSSQDTINAIKRLDSESKKNDGMLDVEIMLMDYQDADSGTAYLFANGAELHEHIKSTYADIAQFKNDEGVETIVKYFVDKQTGRKIQLALDAIGVLLDNTEEAVNDEWAVLEDANNPLKGDLTADDYAALDELVAAAAGAQAHEEEIVNPLKTAPVTVRANINQFNVAVTLKASYIAGTTVDSADTTALEDHSKTIQVLEGATAAEIEQAVAASGIENAALEAWVGINADNYDRTASDLPDTLTGDIEYTITYTPKTINVTYGFETELPTEVPYGYQITLPLNEDDSLVYDYEIGGKTYLQGEVYKVEGEVTVNRSEGKPWSVSKLNAIVADVYADELTEDEKAVLKSVALKGENVLFRIPTNDDGLVTVERDGDNFKVTAEDYQSGIPGVAWKAVGGRVMANGSAVAELTFENGEATFGDVEFDNVEVDYDVTLTSIDAEKVVESLNTPGELATQLKDQKENMEILNSLYDQFAKLDSKTLNQIKVGVRGSDMTEEAKEAVQTIIDGCVDQNAKRLYIYNYLTEYRSNGLTYYYQNNNYARIRSQADILNANLSTIYNDEGFMPLLRDTMEEDADDYYRRVGEIVETMKDVVLTDPDERIDTSSPKLGDLVKAIERIAEPKVFDSADKELTLSTTLVAAAPESAIVTVKVVIKDSKGNATATETDTMTFSTVNPVTSEEAEALQDKIDALVEKAGVDTAHYSTADASTIGAGDTVAENTTITITYTPNEYTATVFDEAEEKVYEQNFYYDVPTVTLPACGENGMQYKYTYGDKEVLVGTEAKSVTFTDAEIDGGAYAEIKRETVDVEREYFLELIDGLNKSVAKAGMLDGRSVAVAFIPMEDADGNLTIVLRISPKNVSKAKNAIRNMAEEITGSNFTHIKLGDEYLREEEKVSIQAVIDAVLNSGMSLDTILNAITKDGKIVEMAPIPGATVIGTEEDGETIKVGASAIIKDTSVLGAYLMESEMTFGVSANDAGKRAKLYVTLEDFGKSTSSLKNLRKMVNKARGYGNAVAHDGMLDVNVKLPEKAYQMFLTAMLGLDNVKLSNLEDPDLVAAAKLALDAFYFIIGDETITTETFENTAAKAGKTVDLSDYSKYYNKARKAAAKLLEEGNPEFTNEQSSLGVYSADVKYDIAKLLDELNIKDSLRGHIKENDSGVKGKVKLTIDNTPNYQAIIVDTDAKGLNKLNYVRNLPRALSKIHDKSAVVLLKDFEGNLVVNKKIVLDLNGHKVSGDLTANATTIVIDSRLDTHSGAGVDGTVSGKATLTAGAYTGDVEAFLKDGYIVDGGTVRNAYYYLVETGDGNVEAHITPDMDEIKDADKKTAQALAIEAAADLALNYYTAAALKVGGNEIYSVTYDDVVSVIDGVSEKDVNDLLACINCAGVTALANDLLDKLVDFSTLAEAVKSGNAVAEYEAVYNPWTYELEHIADGDYLTANIKADTEREKAQTISVFVEDRGGLSDLLEELGKVMTVDAEVELESITYASKTVTAKGNGEATVEIDVTEYPDYAIAVAIELAATTSKGELKDALVEGIKEYYNTGRTAKLKEAYDKVSTRDIVNALSSTKKFDKAITDLGLDGTVAESVKDLYKTYENLIKAVRLINNKIAKIKGSSKKLASLEKSYGEYSATAKNRNVTRSVGAKGYKATADFTATSVKLTVKIFKEETPYKVLVTDKDGNELYRGDSLDEGFEKATDGSTIEIFDNVALENDVTLDREVTVVGADKADLAGHKITLADKNAKLTIDADITDSVVSGSEWSEVNDTPDGENHVYTLKPYDPEILDPTIGSDDFIKGSKIDKDNKYIIIDVVDPASITDNKLAGYGITVDKFNTVVDFETLHASEENYKLYIKGTEAAAGALVPNGAQVVVTATNPDSDVTAEVTYTVVVIGDVNCNGRIDSGDAGLMMRHFFGHTTLEGYRLIAADVNHNDRVDAGDASKNQVKYNRPAGYVSSWN